MLLSNLNFLEDRLNERRTNGALRRLNIAPAPVDFCSNDYLGVVKNNLLVGAANNDLNDLRSGSSGSRLLTGNSVQIENTEKKIANFHDAEAALLFNSGYDANVGLLSCIASKSDTILYDHLSHASIRDGIRLSTARHYSFEHNDLNDLDRKLMNAAGNKFIVTESVFSMDGDTAPLGQILELCEKHNAYLIVDEAHSIGVVGEKGEGLVQSLNIHHRCIARVYTYGKAFGSHGAAIVGSQLLCDYLVNFCRPFIYSTAMAPISVELIARGYDIVPTLNFERQTLGALIHTFQSVLGSEKILKSGTPIQGVIVPGNESVRRVASALQQIDFDVRPIMYPTVQEGMERIRIILHSFNTNEEVRRLAEAILNLL